MSTTIHPTALVEPAAQLDEGVEVGPFCYVGAQVRLGRGTRLQHHSTVDGDTHLGADNDVFPYAFVGGKSQDLKYCGGRTGVRIGDRNVFREFGTVHASTQDGNDTRIGSDNVFLAYHHIAHECEVGNHCIFSNNGTLAGHVVVEDHAIVGGLSAVHQFCRIGQFAMVGGCTKVVQDVPPFMIIDGNPGEVRAVNKVGLERAGHRAEDIELARTVHKVLYRNGLNRGDALAELTAHPQAKSWVIQAVLRFAEQSTRGFAG
ncbi:MAG: acyl-ACP--UDP-N-acetylglucosamine O-acyltransferase [Opitutales bacterium]